MEKNPSNNQFLTIEKNEAISKKRLSGIIFARACCSIGIIIFHFFCHSKGNFKFLYFTPNSSWGFMYVTSFFCISGCVLYYNYPKVNSLKYFYFKRWKSIFPSFYICYSYFFLKNVFLHHKLFFGGHWSRLFFTFFGLDGYLRNKYKTYYIIGEWFLGAIIIIYILYPIMSILMSKNILIIHFIIYSYFIYNHIKNIIILRNTNIFVCINSFYFGMISIKFHNLFFKNKITLLMSFIILVFLCLYKISKNILFFQIQGFTLYIVLIQIGQLLMRTKFKGIFLEISILSYNMLLFHHTIILDILQVNCPKEWYLNMPLLGMAILLTIICSKILFIIVNNIIQSNFFKKIEKYFLK